MTYQLHFESLGGYLDVLARGAALTIVLTAIATVAGLAIGVLGAAARRSHLAPIRVVATAYVELIRNTPFLVQLFFIYFGLPSIGIRLTADEAALLAMIVNLGAYATEIVRAGIASIAKGQVEAGLSLGLTRRQVFLHVVLQPALAKIYPSLTSQFIIVMLGSSVVSQISAEDLTYAANYIQSRNFRSFEVYLTVTAIYLALAIGFRAAFRALGNRVFAHR
jgi:polar amino acid transport system permease protein